MTRPTWIIDTAELGAPETAHCERCGFRWRRPPGDPHADSLPRLARRHVCGEGAEVAVHVADLRSIERTLIDLIADTGDLRDPPGPGSNRPLLLDMLQQVQTMLLAD